MKIDFTPDELNYIEKCMDINSANIEHGLRKQMENFMMLKAMNEEDIAKMASKQVCELGDAYMITKSIRQKLEAKRHAQTKS